ncbi:hypothetical protein P9112_014160 [Eukaryota sp. TZLM1-RC]
MTAVFIFRRDFRLYDNLAWNACVQYCKRHSVPLLPIFCFNDLQLDPQHNPYHSPAGVNFMIQSILDLQKYLSSLCILHGANISILESINLCHSIDAIFFNKDITPYAKQRDSEIKSWCESNNIKCFGDFEDYTIFSLFKVVKADATPYKVYTPFYKNICRKELPLPQQEVSLEGITFVDYESLELSKFKPQSLPEKLFLVGGRCHALKLLQNVVTNYSSYDNTRNDVTNESGTTHLSSFLKFGCLSIREVAKAVEVSYGKDCVLLKQLIWREFYYSITYYFPHILQPPPIPNKALKEEYSDITWRSAQEEPERWEAWCAGRTGVPFVDAGMRQLVETGYMHNRLRMVTSQFLIKNLHIDWRDGERFFANCLVDYDPSLNSGGWQWSASTGADSVPYFRIFNPFLQQRKFDPNALYTKRWLPDLKDVAPKDILNWDNKSVRQRVLRNSKVDYLNPIVDHASSRKETLELYAIQKK